MTSPTHVTDLNGDVRAPMHPEPFENLDRIATVEMRTQGMPAGVVRRLYAASRTAGPLCEELARPLLEVQGRVAILTGIILDGLPHGEVDGPIGASVLAQTLERLDIPADVIVPEEMLDVMTAIRTALGAEFEMRTQARRADGYAAAISIEKLGRNARGVAHTVLGAPLDQGFEADDLIEELNGAGRLTLGIGDGGNEIGFGRMYAAARNVVPKGMACGCPCGNGIVTSTATQMLFPAAVSNHGAYAVAGALAVLAGRPDIFPFPDAVGSAIEASVAAGCRDGGTFYPRVLADDGIPLEAVKAVVAVMRTIVFQNFRRSPRHG
jgi:D-glutamate cyclase